VKALRLFLVTALAALFLSPLAQAPAEAQVSIYDPTVRTTADFVQRRALAKIGRSVGSVQNVAWIFDDLLTNNSSPTIPGGWNVSFSGTGAGDMRGVTDEGGGYYQQTTGATAASFALAQAESPCIRNAGTSPWYFATRSKLTTAVTAQTTAWGGLVNTNAGTISIAAGFFGALHATNFVVQYDGNEAGSFVNLGVAADTASHIIEMWSNGDAKLHCSFDFSAADLCNVTMSLAPTTSMAPRMIARNGTDAVARTRRTDWVAMMCKRT
jgi:hypothetical protein